MNRSPFRFASILLFPMMLAACGATEGNNPTNDPDHPMPAPVDPKGDDDHDGVQNDRDLCPGTTTGTVDKSGCTQAQYDAEKKTNTTTGGNPDNGGTGTGGTNDNGGKPTDNTAKPVTGQTSANGFMTLVLDPGGKYPFVFRTLAQNVTKLATGYAVKGTLLLDAPGGAKISILEGNLTFAYGTDAAGGLESVTGTAQVPVPSLGFLSDLVEAKAPMASVGFDSGDHLASLDAPIAADKKYLYFTYSTELSATAGPVSIAAPGGKSMTALLDPSDPFFFVRADVDGLGPMHDLKEVGFGVSMQGNIPFAPATTWGLPDEVGKFNGQLYVEATAPLKIADLPLELRGAMTVDIDPDHDKITPFGAATAGIQVGANGELNVSVDIVDDIASFQFPLGNASFGAKLAKSNQSAYVSGILRPDTSFLPDSVPIVTTGDAHVAGLIDRSNLSASFFKAEADMTMKASKLASQVGITLNDISVGTASLSIDHSGFQFKGTTHQSISPFIAASNGFSVDAFFSGSPSNWYVGLGGDMAVSGVPLSGNAKALLGTSGIHVTGTYSTPIAAIAMAGDISRSGVNIEGTTSTTIPIVAGNDVLQEVTDAVICGTEDIADAALCGTHMVQDAVLCGARDVADAAKCGTTYVTDGVACGTEYVQSAARCGATYVTDAVKCGASTFSDIAHCGASCITSFFSSCDCTIANSCDFPNSCWAPKSCNIARTCSVAFECEVPKSCPHPKTCKHTVTIPDFNFGSFKAQVHVRIGTSGLEGDVEGDYCVNGGSCTKLAGGRLDLSGAPKACITVPALGEFCAPF
jgi:hypothetical protein